MIKNIFLSLGLISIILLGATVNSYKEKYENLVNLYIDNINYSSSLQGNYEDLPIIEKFKVAAAAYNVDYKLVYAIACHESGNFTSGLFLNKNNPGGIKNGDGWASYGSQFEGIMEMTRLIKRNYIDKGYDTPEKMQPIYCGDSTNWAEIVNSYMASLN